MTRTLSPATWLDHLERVDRVPQFVLQGGSCIRVATSRDTTAHSHLDAELKNFAGRHNFRLLKVSHDSCDRLYMPHMIIKSLASELNLRELFERITRRAWEFAGYHTEGITIGELRVQHNEEPVVLKTQLKNAIDDLLSVGPPLGREYTAVVKNIVRMLAESPAGGASVIGLLEHALAQTATAREIAELGLLRRVSRYNATPTLRKILSLHKLAGWPGVVLYLDLRWASDPLLVDPQRLSMPPRTWRRDIYQWTRELVDLTPELASTFICVEFGETFLDLSPTGRGVGIYDALRLRLAEDAAPRDGANPSAPLVSLEGALPRR